MIGIDIGILIQGLFWTLALTVIAFVLGSLLAIPLLLARRSKNALLRIGSASLVQIIRGIPPILWLFIIFFGIGMGIMPLDPFVAASAGFGLIAAANLSEIYRGALSAVHQGQFEACAALDLGPWSRFRYVIAPQVFRVALPSAVTYLIGLMKETAVASTIGVTDLAFYGKQLTLLTFRGLEVYALVGLFYILISLPIAWLARVADFRLRAKVAR